MTHALARRTDNRRTSPAVNPRTSIAAMASLGGAWRDSNKSAPIIGNGARRFVNLGCIGFYKFAARDRRQSAFVSVSRMQGGWRWVATFGGVFLLVARGSANALESLNREHWVSLDSTAQDQASGVSQVDRRDYTRCTVFTAVYQCLSRTVGRAKSARKGGSNVSNTYSFCLLCKQLARLDASSCAADVVLHNIPRRSSGN